MTDECVVHNGEVWESPNFLKVVVLYIDDMGEDQFCLLSSPSSGRYGHSVCIVHHPTWLYPEWHTTNRELYLLLMEHGWRRTDQQLSLSLIGDE